MRPHTFIGLFLIASQWLCIAIGLAQNGDKQGEIQLPPPSHIVIPPAPPLNVADALKSFTLQPGFEIQLVAHEPLVETPVEIEFGPDGRLWVVEMRSYMPNVDGKGEDLPTGQISILEDTNGDGVMDKKTVFLDKLILPRALALVNGGVLVAEPPNLWFCQDTNRDDRSDVKTLVSNNYGNTANPEHSSNGLMLALDNWIYSANHTNRLRLIDGQWIQKETPFRGQWGLTQDDQGRLFHNSNSDQLRADLIWGDYFFRNSGPRSGFGYNFQVVKDQTVWPGRVNPGVNRGYQKGTLKPDGRLNTFTGACGPCIYRGDQFPPSFRGAAFLCEPTGNFVRCNFLSEREGVISATNAFHESEFLTSTDERFRPVNIVNGPDGNLYVVDMYRGVLQHRVYLTSYLRSQSLGRNLESPINWGRIYRITPSGQRKTIAPNLARYSTVQLVQALNSTNGWIRDTAQRLIIERNDPAAITALRKAAKNPTSQFAGLHTLWTLEGLQAIDDATLESSLKGSDHRIRMASLRLTEPRLNSTDYSPWLQKIISSPTNATASESAQLAFTLGALTKNADPLALQQRSIKLQSILHQHKASTLVRDAVFSSLGGHEIAFLNQWVQTTSKPFEDDASVAKGLAKMVGLSAKPEDIEQLFDMADRFPIYASSLLSGLWSIQPPTKATNASPVRIIKLSKEPSTWVKLKSSTPLAVIFNNVDRMVKWPGKPGFDEPKKVLLTEEEKKLFEEGKTLYQTTCGSCHQPHGLGQDGLAPALADSEWTTGSSQRLVRIALHGVRGPITVKGKLYEMDMPGLGVLEDSQIASLLTYIRQEWGHNESAVSVQQVAKIRADTISREEAWKVEELEKIP